MPSPLPRRRPRNAPSSVSRLGAFLLVAWLLPLAVAAQPLESYEIEVFGVARGLSNSNVFAIAEDHLGYLWIGTENGLNQFDGKNFRVFRKERGKAGSLPSNWVSAVYEDRERRLWLGTPKGVCRFARDQDVFELVPGAKGEVWSFAELRGDLLVGTETGLWVYSREQGVLERASRLRALDGTPIRDLLAAGDALYVATWGAGLFRLDGRGLAKLELPELLHVRALGFSGRGELLAGTPQGLFAVGLGGEVPGPTRSLVPDVYVTDLQPLGGQILVATLHHGVLDLAEGQAPPSAADLAAPSRLPRRRVWALYPDSLGQIWIGVATGGGLCRLSRTALLKIPLGGGEITLVHGLAVDRGGATWLATSQGLQRAPPGRAPSQSPGPPPRFSPFALAGGAWPRHFWDLAFDAEDRLWVGTFAEGLLRVDPASGAVEPFLFDQDGAVADRNRIRDVVFQPPRTLWVGTDGGGLVELDTGTGRAVYHDVAAGQGGAVWKVQPAGDLLWLATVGQGVIPFDLQRRRVAEHLVPREINRLCGSQIFTLLETPGGRNWLGTLDEGLCAVDLTRDRVLHRYDAASGLPGNTVYGLAAEAAGLWVGGNSGIAFLRTEERGWGTPIMVGRAVELNHDAALPAPGGGAYFGMAGGLALARLPAAEASVPPRWVLSEVLANGQVAARDLGDSATLELGPGVETLGFRFTTFEAAGAPPPRLHFRIEGLAPAWTPLPADSAVIVSARRGRFELQIRDLAAESPALFRARLHIRPAFHETWLFRGGIALALGAAAWLIVARRRPPGNEIARPAEESREPEVEARPPGEVDEILTPGDVELLKLVEQGLTDKEIGKLLKGISHHTVKNRLALIKKKLGVTSQRANRLGLKSRHAAVKAAGELMRGEKPPETDRA